MDVIVKLHNTKEWLVFNGLLSALSNETFEGHNENGSPMSNVGFRNPLLIIQTDNINKWPPLGAECIVHGDLHIRNICVVDHDPCLIDFGNCGYGHPFRDFAMLEASMRYGLNSPSYGTAKDVYASMSREEMWSVERDLISRPTLSPGWNMETKSPAERIPRLTIRIRQEAQLMAWRARANIPAGQDEVEDTIALFFSLLKIAGIKRIYSNETEEKSKNRRLIAFMAAGRISESLASDLKLFQGGVSTVSGTP